MSKGKWDALDCVALAKRALEQEGDEYEGAACGVVFAFGKADGRWTVIDAKPANGRWSKAKNAALDMVRCALRSGQGE